MDAFTLRHLDAWLDRQVDDEDARAAVRAAMVALVDTNVDYWTDCGWPVVFDNVKGWLLVARVEYAGKVWE